MSHFRRDKSGPIPDCPSLFCSADMSKPSLSAPTRAFSLQFKLLGALSVGLAVVVLCAVAGLGSAWLNLSTTIPPEVARNAQAEALQREFRMQVQEWKNVLLRGGDPALLERHWTAFVALLLHRRGSITDLGS